jgi:hypothetical protein
MMQRMANVVVMQVMVGALLHPGFSNLPEAISLLKASTRLNVPLTLSARQLFWQLVTGSAHKICAAHVADIARLASKGDLAPIPPHVEHLLEESLAKSQQQSLKVAAHTDKAV